MYSEIGYPLPHTVQHRSTDFQPMSNLIVPVHSLHFIAVYLLALDKQTSFNIA